MRTYNIYMSHIYIYIYTHLHFVNDVIVNNWKKKKNQIEILYMLKVFNRVKSVYRIEKFVKLKFKSLKEV